MLYSNHLTSSTILSLINQLLFMNLFLSRHSLLAILYSIHQSCPSFFSFISPFEFWAPQAYPLTPITFNLTISEPLSYKTQIICFDLLIWPNVIRYFHLILLTMFYLIHQLSHLNLYLTRQSCPRPLSFKSPFVYLKSQY